VRLAYDFPGVQAERVRWYENAKLVLPALGFSVTTLLLAALAPFIRAVRRVVFSRRPPLEPQPGTRWLPRVTQVGAWIWVLLFSSLFIFLSAVGWRFSAPYSGLGQVFLSHQRGHFDRSLVQCICDIFRFARLAAQGPSPHHQNKIHLGRVFLLVPDVVRDPLEHSWPGDALLKIRLPFHK